MNQRFKYFIQGAGRLGRVIGLSFGIHPYYFLIVTLLRTTIRLLYFVASVLPFKILLILSTDFSIPSFLTPYFSDSATLAYTLCLFTGLAVLIAKGLEVVIDNVTRIKTKAVLGKKYESKRKKRGRLNEFIRKSADAASGVIVMGFSIILLLVIHPEIALMVSAASVGCLALASIAKGKLAGYVENSPTKYIENCLTGITLFSFFYLVHHSINSATPPPFLILLVCFILIRHYTQAVEQVISTALFFRNEDAAIGRVFTRL